MKLNFSVNPNHVPAKQTFQLIPSGDYIVQVIEVVKKTTTTGAGLNLTFKVLEGPYTNRLVWVLLNLSHPDATVQQRAYDELQRLCNAVALTGDLDTDDLLRKPLVARIYETKPKPGYPTKNSARLFRAVDACYPASMKTQLDAKFAESAEATTKHAEATPASPAAPTPTEIARKILAKHRGELAKTDEATAF